MHDPDPEVEDVPAGQERQEEEEVELVVGRWKPEGHTEQRSLEVELENEPKGQGAQSSSLASGPAPGPQMLVQGAQKFEGGSLPFANARTSSVGESRKGEQQTHV